MIEFDYKIVRNEGDEITTYQPKVPKELNDIVLISGPNSSGKSTLLNLFAAGFWGKKNKNIRETLNNRIQALLDSNHQEVSFNIKIKNEKNNLELVAKKDPKKDTIKLSEKKNGKTTPLSYELFSRNYNLIYDIPENPLDRLEELTGELKDIQGHYGRKVGHIFENIRSTIEDLRASKDPKKIDYLKKLVKQTTKEIEDLKSDNAKREKEIKIIRTYFHSRLYVVLYERFNQTDIELKGLKRGKREKKRSDRAEENEYRNLKDERVKVLFAAKKLYESIISSFSSLGAKTKKNYLDLWKQYDLRKILEDDSRHYIIFEGIEELLNRINEIHKAAVSEDKLKESKLIRELVDLLDNYTSSNLVIPGLGKTVIELKSLLVNSYKEYEHINITNENYERLKNELDELQSHSESFIKIMTEFNSLPSIDLEEEDYEEEKYDQERKRLSTELDDLKTRIEFHRDELIKLGIKEDEIEDKLYELNNTLTVKPYKIYDDKSLKHTIDDEKKNLKLDSESIKEKEFHVKKWGEEIIRLENKEEHKYQHYEDELTQLLNLTLQLKQKLSVIFDEYLKDLKRNNINNLSQEKKNYYDAIGYYLAKKLEIIRHVDKEYKVKKIDIINKIIETSTNKKIFFTDFGTGQGQSAYLKSLLNTSDKRKMIVLIDEVAMLDTNSLESVLEIIREQYSKGKLIAAIVVQREDKLNVKPI